MNILIVNIHSNRNAGDAVLLQVAMQQLRDLFPGCTITLAMNDPDSYDTHNMPSGDQVVGSFTNWFKQPSRSGSRWQITAVLAFPWLLLQILLAAITVRFQALFLTRRKPISFGLSAPRQALLQAYSTADLIVSCPGNFLYSSGFIGIPLLLAFFAMGYGLLMGKAVCMMPQTLGPLQRRWEYAILRWLLPRLQVVLLREQTSLRVLEEARISLPHCLVVPDVAFLYQGASMADGEALLTELGIDRIGERPLLGVTLINWGGQNHQFTGQDGYEAAIADAIEFFIQSYSGSAVLFSQVHGPTTMEDDRIPARRVYEKLSHCHQHLFLVERAIDTAQLQAAYGAMTIFIGSRLHSNIFALTRTVPVLAIAYQYKTLGVMEMVGLGEWVLEIESIQAAELITLLQRLWTERSSLRAELIQRIPQLQAEIRTQLALIQQTYVASSNGLHPRDIHPSMPKQSR